ncbi:hypothetical protein CPB85DRAFT_1560573 [Mucidula mucida]|nr:hypothetical protein CPB85DRAFT_1560573 [Mucidula mucida]
MPSESSSSPRTLRSSLIRRATEFVTQLNNCTSYFQAKGDTTSVSYQESVEGPSDKAQWTVICKGEPRNGLHLSRRADLGNPVSGQTKGTGKAASKAAAKEEAARQTLQALGVAV